MFGVKSKVVSVVMGMFLTYSAHANLVVNGSFENNTVNNGSWKWFPASQVDGWEGSNVEIWHNLSGITAPDGVNIAELNADGGNVGAWSIFQNLNTVKGVTYDVSFSYRARLVTDLFDFTLGSINQHFVNNDKHNWKLFTASFVATSNVSQLRFTSGNAGTLGNLIDNVVVNGRASVPESSAFVLFAIGLLGLFAARKRS